jgi:hypothetical protein
MIKIMSLEETCSAHDRAVAIFKERGDVILYGTNFLSEWKVDTIRKS